MSTDKLVDVALVFANPVLHPYAQPYGLTIIKSHLDSHGISSRLLMPFQARNPGTRLEQGIRSLCPRVIGFSFRNLDPAGYGDKEEPYTFLSSLESLLTIAKAHAPTAVTVVGGSGFTTDPVGVLKSCDFDLGFLGPCEKEFAEFTQRYIDSIKANTEPDLRKLTDDLSPAVVNSNVEALTRNSRNVSPRSRLPKTLPPTQPIGEFQAIDLARVHGATYPVRTKTGCSLRCSYCVVPFIERMNLRPTKEILEELRVAVRLGMGKSIFLADGEFNLPSEQRARHICRRIRESFGQDVRWRCYVCPSQMSPGLAGEMLQSGCLGVGVTVDSFADSVRDLMNKRCSAQKAEDAVRALLDVGVESNITLLFGSAGETEQTLQETLAVATKLLQEGAHISITVGLRIYPGTPLAAQAKKEEFRSHVHCQNEEGVPIFSSPYPRERLCELLKDALPRSRRIHWTKPVGSGQWREFVKLAQIHDCWSTGDFSLARRLLDDERNALARVGLEVNRAVLESRIHQSKGDFQNAAKVLEEVVPVGK